MPNEDWMAPFSDRDDLTLVDVTFPGSHDAGLHEDVGGFTGYTAVASSDDTICQESDILGQLVAGSRAFDLRIAKRNGVLRTFHGEGNPLALAGGGWGQNALSVFQQVNGFLGAHDGEIVILRISHSEEKDGIHKLLRRVIAPNRLYCASPRNLAKVPLSHLRGKALAIFDEHALAKSRPFQGLHRLAKYSEDKAPGEGLPICGKYAGQFAGTLTGNQKMRKMAQLALECGNAHIGHQRGVGGKHSHILMIYWQLAWNVKDKTVNPDGQRDPDLARLDDTRGTHYNLDYLLNAHRGRAGLYRVTHNPKVGMTKRVSSQINSTNYRYHRPNWINLDFINDEVCNKIIEFNTDLMPPAG